MFYKKGGKMRLCTLRETPIYTKMVNAFFNEDEKGDLHAYVAKHAKAKQEHIPAHLLKAIVKELNND